MRRDRLAPSRIAAGRPGRPRGDLLPAAFGGPRIGATERGCQEREARGTITHLRSNFVRGNREIRSNLEWKLTPGVSVQGSYDNVYNVSSSAVGNLGADVRWRLEFE